MPQAEHARLRDKKTRVLIITVSATNHHCLYSLQSLVRKRNRLLVVTYWPVEPHPQKGAIKFSCCYEVDKNNVAKLVKLRKN